MCLCVCALVRVYLCMYMCVTGDDMDHEHDTVLQLQEVIEQLRNVFPSEPGESDLSDQIDSFPLYSTIIYMHIPAIQLLIYKITMTAVY